MGYQTYSYKDQLTGRDRYRTEWVDDPKNDYNFKVARTATKAVLIPVRKDTPRGLVVYNYRIMAQNMTEAGLDVTITDKWVETPIENMIRFNSIARQVLGNYYEISEGATQWLNDNRPETPKSLGELLEALNQGRIQ
jgi:hypothetical protein